MVGEEHLGKKFIQQTFHTYVTWTIWQCSELRRGWKRSETCRLLVHAKGLDAALTDYIYLWSHETARCSTSMPQEGPCMHAENAGDSLYKPWPELLIEILRAARIEALATHCGWLLYGICPWLTELARIRLRVLGQVCRAFRIVSHTSKTSNHRLCSSGTHR